MSIATGHTNAQNVPSVLTIIRGIVPPDSLTIIRCIDSETQPISLSEILSNHQVQHETSNGAVHTQLNQLTNAIERNLFNGFDELWLFPLSPTIPDIPDHLTATSDDLEFNNDNTTELLAYMESSNCFLVLGDGCGLNYATTNVDVAKAIRSTDNTSDPITNKPGR